MLSPRDRPANAMFSANEIVAPAQRLSGLVLKRGPKQGSKWQTRFVELHDREVRVWVSFARMYV